MNNIKFPVVMEGAIGSETIQTVNGRDLHRFLEVGKDFSTWIKDRVAQYGFSENTDYVVFPEIGENSKGGRPSKEYAVSIDMAKELAMVERNEKGKQARQYFIECERRAKNAVDPVAVLNNPAAMRGLLLTYSEKVIELEGRIEADKPKTSFFDAYINAEGLYNLQNAGRALNARPNLFIRYLKEKYMFYQGTALVPRVQYIQMGLFEVKSEIVEDKVRPRSYMTAKGLEYFSKRLPDHIRVGKAA
ncbi:antA/AntB antirepressor family protein [Pseudochrobactrum sp. sp1633]|uniref:antA/AntB antirepressor family protein n=1 Tax=Pseudochrobactrum sp. sp1633 TaxID=3036706 RepID=UPI0025A667BB|nr:antA/AntB antirepressor family protein [Pseudochrobactrum sp. sp1633]MDM8346457.1 antA/AntB antirepressor family protein [Pseudochrobactrum sp. sp1633]